jgi:hypothetical protein
MVPTWTVGHPRVVVVECVVVVVVERTVVVVVETQGTMVTAPFRTTRPVTGKPIVLKKFTVP